MKRFGCMCLTALVLSISSANSFGAQATLEWKDGAQCRFATKFDPAKYDRDKLKNTIDVIYGDNFFDIPSLAVTFDQNGQVKAKVGEFQQACERKKDIVAGLPLLPLPAIEDARKLSLEQLEETCGFETIKGRAALGDPAALREFAPSVAQCSVYIDALEGKTDLRAVWRDVADSTCRSNAQPETCKADFFAAETRSNPEARIRDDVLMFGWNNCSTRYLKMANVQKKASLRTALDEQLRRLFRIKTYPCAD